MFEQDYIMRMIIQLVRSLIKLIFHKDLNANEEIQDTDTDIGDDAKDKYRMLLELADKGEINKAENRLYAELDISNMEDLKTALLFYQHLGTFERDFLEQYDFTPDEILEGIEHVLNLYGYHGFGDIFMQGL